MTNRKVIKTPRGAHSRQVILDATGRLIARYGGNQVTLDQVAEECNISKSSILWHFGSKDELLLEVVDTVYHRFAEAIINKYTAELSPIEKITHLLNGYRSISIDRPEIPTIFFSFVLSNKAQTKIQAKIKEIYEWNRQAYMQHLGISGNMAAMLLGMINGILIQWLMDPDQIEIEMLLKEMIPVFDMLIENEKAPQRRLK